MKPYTLRSPSIFLGFALACLAPFFPLYGQAGMDRGPTTEEEDRSYAYGLIIGSDLKTIGLEFDYYALSQGLRDALEDRDSRISLDEAVALIQQSNLAMMERQSEENRLSEIRFLEENGKREGVFTTASGLQYEILREEGGEKPNPNALVRVNYEGTFTNGTIFDSSYLREEPDDIPLDRVIPGWSEGLCLMGEGDMYTLYIPSHLAYGESGAQNVIPPYTTLIFKVELLAILDEGQY